MKKLMLSTTWVLCLFLLIGCWSQKEFNELALIMGLGVDKVDDKYRLSIQVAIPGEISGEKGSGNSAIRVFSSDGNSVCDAFREITNKIPRKPYLAHAIIIILSEETAREGIGDVIDCMVRDNEIRPSTQILISKDATAEEVLSMVTSIERIPSSQITKIVINAETNYSILHTVQLNQLIGSLVSDGKSAVIPGITITGEKEKGNELANLQKAKGDARIELMHYGVFKKDQFIGWLDHLTSKGYTHINGKVGGTMIGALCGENLYNMYQVNKTSTSIKAKIIDKKPKIIIEHKLEGEVCQAGCEIDLTKPKEIKKLEKQFEEVIKGMLLDSVKTVQTDYKTDIFGFGDVIHRKDPKLWKNLSKDWDKHFETLEVDVKVQVEIKRPGQILKSFKKDIK